MSQHQLFNCPDCYSEVRGSLGAALTCATCACQFTGETAAPLDEDELTLAPITETPAVGPPLPSTVTGTATTALHLEEEVSQPDQPCKQCNQRIDRDALECPHCGFNATLGRNFDPTELDPYHGVFGFDRYLMRHTQDNNTGGLMLWLHVFLGFVGIVTMLVWSGWMYLVVPTLALVYTIYRVHANHSNAFQRGKGLIPKLLLLYNRLTTWKGFVSGDNPDNCILSMRSSRFNDNAIASIVDPEAIEILDIAGSSVTDNGVRYLATFSNLRALVVVSCAIDENALDELQLALPRLCIWRP
jgi:ribosomal protein L37AE/L43A